MQRGTQVSIGKFKEECPRVLVRTDHGDGDIKYRWTEVSKGSVMVEFTDDSRKDAMGVYRWEETAVDDHSAVLAMLLYNKTHAKLLEAKEQEKKEE
jgi:hypothetical protein